MLICGSIFLADMARITGLERNQAPWHLRWFYGAMRKMFGKDLTPVKLQMRFPGMVWGSIVIVVMIFRPQGILGRDTLTVRRWFRARPMTTV